MSNILYYFGMWVFYQIFLPLFIVFAFAITIMSIITIPQIGYIQAFAFLGLAASILAFLQKFRD